MAVGFILCCWIFIAVYSVRKWYLSNIYLYIKMLLSAMSCYPGHRLRTWPSSDINLIFKWRQQIILGLSVLGTTRCVLQSKMKLCKSKICHICECQIELYVPLLTVWHRQASLLMPKGGPWFAPHSDDNITQITQEKDSSGTNWNCLGQIHDIPLNQTSDVHQGFTLITCADVTSRDAYVTEYNSKCDYSKTNGYKWSLCFFQ